MMIALELQAMQAPRNVVDAGKEIDKRVQAGLRPPMEYVAYVRNWVNKQRENNRYGK